MKADLSIAVVSAILMFGLSGCRDGGGPRSGSKFAPNSGALWALDTIPMLTLGAADSLEPYQFYRAGGAIRLDAGEIVVANAGTQQIRIFDRNGSFLRQFGGPGNGPAEFSPRSSYLRLCRSTAGTLAIVDQHNARIEHFSLDGRFLKSVSIASSSGRPAFVAGCFKDGSLLATKTLYGSGVNADDSIEYARYSPEGIFQAVVVRLPQPRRTAYKIAGRTWHAFVPFAPFPVVAPGAEHLYSGVSGSARIEKRRLDGTLVSTIEWVPEERRRVSDVWTKYKRAIDANASNDAERTNAARFLDQDLPLPDWTPVFDELRVDVVGNLWVQRSAMVWDTIFKWDVFSSEGERVASIDIPARLNVIEIGEDYVLGKSIDELGVERIAVYEIKKISGR